MRTRLFIAACLLLSGCNGDDRATVEIVQMTVAPHKVQCFSGGLERGCLFARNEGETDFSSLHGKIEGFDFRWGVTQVIEVERTFIGHAPVDGVDHEYRLIRKISESPAQPQSTFQLSLPIPGSALEQVAPQPDGMFGELLYTLFDEQEVVCENSVCGVYEDALAVDGNAILLLMIFESLDPLAIRLVQVECVAPRGSFETSCL